MSAITKSGEGLNYHSTESQAQKDDLARFVTTPLEHDLNQVRRSYVNISAIRLSASGRALTPEENTKIKAEEAVIAKIFQNFLHSINQNSAQTINSLGVVISL